MERINHSIAFTFKCLRKTWRVYTNGVVSDGQGIVSKSINGLGTVVQNAYNDAKPPNYKM